MKDLFVPYEQSLQLEELGFDEPCFGFYAVFSIVWVFMSPLMFGMVIPFIYHYIIMDRGNNDPYGDSAIIFFAYIVLWFWIHESYIKHKKWFF